MSEVATWPASNQLPPYVLNVELVAWLVERMGFEGGGGGRAGGTMTATTMTKLVVDPSALADEIDRFGTRVAEASEAANEAITAARFGALAAEVRRQAGLISSV